MTADATERFPVGSTVILGNWRMGNRARTQRLVVTKVARKYVTAVADVAAEKARLAATERLRALGVRHYDLPRGLSTDALNAIADLVAADLGVTP